MTVTLTPHLKKFVNAKVKRGGYADRVFSFVKGSG